MQPYENPARRVVEFSSRRCSRNNRKRLTQLDLEGADRRKRQLRIAAPSHETPKSKRPGHRQQRGDVDKVKSFPLKAMAPFPINSPAEPIKLFAHP